MLLQDNENIETGHTNAVVSIFFLKLLINIQQHLAKVKKDGEQNRQQEEKKTTKKIISFLLFFFKKTFYITCLRLVLLQLLPNLKYTH